MTNKRIPATMPFLIVDDQTTVRRLIITTLKSLKFKGPFYEAKDGNDAVNLLEQHYYGENRIKFILCDWSMPDMDGFAFLKYVREGDRFQNLPFVMITTQTDKEKIMEAIESGISNYILKPWTANVFKEKIFKAWLKHHGEDE